MLERLAQHHRALLQILISRRVPERIIDPLQPVQVSDKNREFAGRPILHLLLYFLRFLQICIFALYSGQRIFMCDHLIHTQFILTLLSPFTEFPGILLLLLKKMGGSFVHLEKQNQEEQNQRHSDHYRVTCPPAKQFFADPAYLILNQVPRDQNGHHPSCVRNRHVEHRIPVRLKSEYRLTLTAILKVLIQSIPLFFIQHTFRRLQKILPRVKRTEFHPCQAVTVPVIQAKPCFRILRVKCKLFRKGFNIDLNKADIQVLPLKRHPCHRYGDTDMLRSAIQMNGTDHRSGVRKIL